MIVEINKIEFKDTDKVPRISGNEYLRHDPNLYQDGRYRRRVLKYGKGLLNFQNYVYSDWGPRYNSGGSGTYIDFVIKVKDALPDTSVLFYLDDLDVAAKQEWTKGTNPANGDDDWHWDTLEYNKNTYGLGSEGIVLGSGNDLDTLKFAEHTGLERRNESGNIDPRGNYIVPTGSDPSTAWSALSVRADASGSNYTWTSGIGCDTNLLKNTDGPNKPEKKVYIFPQALKTVNNAMPVGDYESNAFDFTLEPSNDIDLSSNPVVYEYEEIENGTHTNKSISLTTNNASGNNNAKNQKNNVRFSELSFNPPASPNLADAYIYKITEQEGINGDVVDYNTEDVTYYLQVVVSKPRSDLELAKGTKAEVTIGKKVKNGPINWDVEGTQTVWSIDAQPALDADNNPITKDGNTVYTDGSGKKFYREDGKFLSYSPESSSEDNPELTVAKNEQEPKTIEYDSDNDGTKESYTIKKDRDGVEYIAVTSGSTTKYLDPNNNFDQLLETVDGDVYPQDTDKTTAEVKEVNNKEVKIDVHGIEYIVDGDNYYSAADGTTELNIKDGIFNPDLSDRTVYEEKKVTKNGTEYIVKIDTIKNI